MKTWLFALLSILLCVTCYGHTVHLGRTCPDVKAFPNLSVNKILGEWFVSYQFDTSNTCLIWNITKPNSQLDQLEITEIRQLSVLDTFGIDHKQAVTGIADIANPEVPSRMRIRWPTSLTGKADFIVFDTDYENYLAIFQCDRAGVLHRRDVTVLSRKPEIDVMFIDRVRRLLETAQVTHTSLDEISHHLCRDRTLRNWHIKGELFGLLPPYEPAAPVPEEMGQNIKNFDISQLEIIGDRLDPLQKTQKTH